MCHSTDTKHARQTLRRFSEGCAFSLRCSDRNSLDLLGKRTATEMDQKLCTCAHAQRRPLWICLQPRLTNRIVEIERAIATTISVNCWRYLHILHYWILHFIYQHHSRKMQQDKMQQDAGRPNHAQFPRSSDELDIASLAQCGEFGRTSSMICKLCVKMIF